MAFLKGGKYMRQITLNMDKRDAMLYNYDFIRQGENLATEITINLSEEFRGYRYNLSFQNNSNEPVVTEELTAVNNAIKYKILNSVTKYSGELKIQLNAFNDSGLVAKAYTKLKISEGIDGGAIMPEAYVPWYVEAVNAASTATTKAEEAAASAAVAGSVVDTKVAQLNARIDTIITTPASGVTAQEIIDARQGEASLGAKIVKIDNQLKYGKIKKYGVKFTGSNPVGERLYDSVGMVANAAVDNQLVQNDFDNVPFFNRPMCNVYFDTNGNPKVMAYRGEPGFNFEGAIFPPYADKADVYYECTPCGWNGSFDEPVVAGTPCEGIELFSFFPNWNTKMYLPTFWMSTENGKPTSRSGVRPGYYSLNSAMSVAQAWNANAHTETIAAHTYEYILQIVEFATRDVQTIMMGCSALRYNSATDVSVIAETAVNRIIVSNATASNYVVGQTIVIGTTQNGTQVAGERSITAIDVYDTNNKAIVFDGTPVNIAVGNFVSSRVWKNGATNVVVASSGSPVSNTSGKYPCIWRGKVDPWAQGFSVLCDFLIKRNGAGTTESPYTYKPHFLSNPRKYSNGTITSDYIEVQYNLPQVDGYVKTLQQDSRYKHLVLTKEVGASSTTYLAAYYYYPRYDICVVFVGGNFIAGRYCSPVYFYCTNTPSNSNFYYLARLFVSRA